MRFAFTSSSSAMTRTSVKKRSRPGPKDAMIAERVVEAPLREEVVDHPPRLEEVARERLLGRRPSSSRGRARPAASGACARMFCIRLKAAASRREVRLPRASRRRRRRARRRPPGRARPPRAPPRSCRARCPSSRGGSAAARSGTPRARARRPRAPARERPVQLERVRDRRRAGRGASPGPRRIFTTPSAARRSAYGSREPVGARPRPKRPVSVSSRSASATAAPDVAPRGRVVGRRRAGTGRRSPARPPRARPRAARRGRPRRPAGPGTRGPCPSRGPPS